MSVFFLLRKSDYRGMIDEESISNVLITCHIVSPLSSVVSWLVVGLLCCTPDAAKYPSTFADRRQPSYASSCELPSGTGPAGALPKASRRHASKVAPGFYFDLQENVCYVLYSKQIGDGLQTRYTAGTGPYLNRLPRLGPS